MQKIGIIGGLGPEATADYYKRITRFFHEYNKSLATPDIIIYSVDMAQLFKFADDGRFDEMAHWLACKVAALKDAGADFAAIASNTPHVVFDAIRGQSPLPLISIVQATLDAAKLGGFRKLALLGTGLTMRTNFYGDRFAAAEIAVVTPDPTAQRYIENKLDSEIERGIFHDSTLRELLAIIDGMKHRHAVDGVILGCTELPLILEDGAADIPFLNTTAIHVNAICQRWIEGRQDNDRN